MIILFLFFIITIGVLIFAIRVLIGMYTPNKRSHSYEPKEKTPEEFAEEQRQREEAERAHRERIEKYNATLESIPRTAFVPEGEKQKKRALRDMPEISFSNITTRTNVRKIFPLVVLDVETTGIKLQGNYVIEVSAIKFEESLSVATSCFTTLVNPGRDLPPEITELTGITDSMLADKPYFYQVRDAFNAYIEGCNIAGHNLEFDMKFLFVNGIDFQPTKTKYFDTLQIAQKILKKPKKKWDKELECYMEDYETYYDVDNYKLETLCQYYRIFRDDAHRSLSDCLATAVIFKAFLEAKGLLD